MVTHRSASSALETSRPREKSTKNVLLQSSKRTPVSLQVHNDESPTEALSQASHETESTCASADAPGSLSSYRISKEVVDILSSRGISALFPIQQKTFDAVYDGKHVIGRARTGTGKTLAFALPSVEALTSSGRFKKKGCRILALLPTRELAQQVAAEFDMLGRDGTSFRTATVVGGLPEEPQLRALNQGAQVVVGTPGRILDFLNRGSIDLKKLRVFVLDEADQMLEMGFKEDVDSVLEYVNKANGGRQSTSGVQVLLFTATLPAWVNKIAEEYMKSGEKVVVDVVQGEKTTTASGIRHLTIVCGFHQRAKVLGNIVSHYAGATGRCIIFVETKANANDIAMNSEVSHICQVLHGDIPQKQREVTLKAFKEGRFRCLVATDVAARGLHVDNIELVVQLEPPKDVDTFIHRSGRTGRAGAKGTNIVFLNPMNAPFIKTIESSTGIRFTRVGIPQAEQLVTSAAQRVAENVAALPVANSKAPLVQRCKEAASFLITQLGPEEAVSRLILELTGFNKKDNTEMHKVYSALTGNEDYRTYQVVLLSGETQIHSKNYIWQLLKNRVGIDQDTLNLFQSMTLRADATGALFDVPLGKIETFEQCLASAMESPKNQESFAIEVATELPELNDARMTVYGSPSVSMKNPLARGAKRRRDDSRPWNGRDQSKWQRTYEDRNQHWSRR